METEVSFWDIAGETHKPPTHHKDCPDFHASQGKRQRSLLGPGKLPCTKYWCFLVDADGWERAIEADHQESLRKRGTKKAVSA